MTAEIGTPAEAAEFKAAKPQEAEFTDKQRYDELRQIKTEGESLAQDLYQFFMPKIENPRTGDEERQQLVEDYKKNLARLEKSVMTADQDSKFLATKMGMEAPKEGYLEMAKLKTHLIPQTAVFFDERRAALAQADPSNSELAGFTQAGTNYFQTIQDLDNLTLDMAGVYDQRAVQEYQEEVKIFDLKRSQAHDQVLTALNHLNQKAKSVGTQPFTLHDFLIEKRGANKETISGRAYNDRKLAAWYLFEVFRDVLHARVPKEFDP